MNGLGSFLTNIFSKKFEVDTDDGVNLVKLRCSENCSNVNFEILKTTKKRGTKVYFEPDFSKFEIDEFEDIYFRIIKQRLLCLSVSFPQIEFSFNGEKIKHKKTKDFFENYFDEKFLFHEEENFIVGISTNESNDFRQMSYVNGLEMFVGGTHIEFLQNNLLFLIREFIAKKYKNIKIGDVKSRVQLVVFVKNFPNPEFDSQTKQKLTNSYGFTKKYFAEPFNGEEPFKELAKAAFKEPLIVDPITEIYRIKEEYERRQLLKNADKDVEKRVKIDKFLQPTKNWNRLYLDDSLSYGCNDSTACSSGTSRSGLFSAWIS